ncbi:MAG: ribonuclease III [Clostridiales bacterium]|nr:ribonuclease III [Clostridiales bacterium]
MNAPVNKQLNTTALAFMGDAVYELRVREKVVQSGQASADKLHGMAVKYVNAEAQAKALKAIFDELSEEEQDLVRRARNRKPATKPKNADPLTYKLASAFEALVGHLYLTGDEKRLGEIVSLAFSATKDRAKDRAKDGVKDG